MHRLAVSTARERLAQAVYARRYVLGIRTQQALAEKAGVSRTMVGRVERGVSVGRAVLTAIEVALGWEAGSCDAILGGGHATLVQPTPPPPDPGAELRQEIARLRIALGRDKFIAFVEELVGSPEDHTP